MKITIILLLVFALWPSSQSEAAAPPTFYIHGSGLGATTCNATSCRTLCANPGTPCNINRLMVPGLAQAGDIWLIRNGSQNLTTRLDINCASGGINSGNSNSKITLKAENERQAHFIVGSNDFRWFGCSHWIIEGLRISGPSTAGSAIILFIDNSSDMVVRRMLFHNAFDVIGSTSVVQMWGSSTANLIEDNEIYDSYRHMIHLGGTTNSIYRRNYGNPRQFGATGCTITVYPGSGNIFENNIADGNCIDMPVAYGASTNNTFLGNITIGNVGVAIDCRQPSTDSGLGRPQNTVMKNNVNINSMHYGMQDDGGQGTVFENNSVFGVPGGSNWGFIFYDNCNEFGGAPSLTGKNNLVVGVASGSIGIRMDASNWSLQKTNVFGATTPYSPTSGDSRYNGTATTTNPSLGDCKIIIPPGPMKGAGVNPGEDIGANIRYRYVNGTLTTQELWNWNKSGSARGEAWRAVDGGWAGAIIPGVNDGSADLAGLHARVGFGPGNCPSPVITVLSSLSTVPKVPARFPIQVQITNAPGFVRDWLGMYSGETLIAWFYMNNTQTLPSSPITNTTLTFTAPPTPGNYQFRLYRNDSIDVGDLMATADFHDFVGRLLIGTKSIKANPARAFKVQGGS